MNDADKLYQNIKAGKDLRELIKQTVESIKKEVEIKRQDKRDQSTPNP